MFKFNPLNFTQRFTDWMNYQNHLEVSCTSVLGSYGNPIGAKDKIQACFGIL